MTFNATVIGNDKVQVDGTVSATAILSRLFGVNLVPTASSGVAQKKEVEIMLVLDRSGSMGDYGDAHRAPEGGGRTVRDALRRHAGQGQDGTHHLTRPR